MLKQIILLYLLTQDSNYCLSIREDIEFARKFLKYHGISDEKLCTNDTVKELCSSEQKELCSARLSNKKMEFKQFDNPCYMDLNNFCENQDNIWAIKNAGPCVMDAETRRYAKEIEKMADADPHTETNDDQATDETGNTETTTDVTETVTENGKTEITTDETVTEDNETQTTTDEVTNESDATESTTDEMKVTDTTINEETETNYALRVGEEIGKIVYDDGSEKVLRQGSSRFPPMAEKAWDGTPCKKRVKPCPIIYYPICLYYEKENPNKLMYYHFINGCEGQQWSCYHPERKVQGRSSMRAGYCAHIQYINYARYSHTMFAWSHYGWLHGPGRLSHILKPHQRA